MSMPAITARRVASFSLAATRHSVHEPLDVSPIRNHESFEAELIAREFRLEGDG